MKTTSLLLLLCSSILSLHAQTAPNEKQRKELQSLIDQYSLARENSDTVLLKKILTGDIDQLVSSGEWRTGIAAAVKGMLNSSAGNPGTRTLTVDKIRMLSNSTALVDCRYEIRNPAGEARNMWSCFIAVAERGSWKITAIRNMMPAR